MRYPTQSGFWFRLILFGLIWWALTGGQGSAWWWGVPVVTLCALITPSLPGPRWRWRLLPFLQLLPHILLLSLKGGLEVTWLACKRRPALNTQMLTYPWTHLSERPQKLFMASLINLIPGTLTVNHMPEQQGVQVHVLHMHESTKPTLRALERRVALLYGDTAATAGRSDD